VHGISVRLNINNERYLNKLADDSEEYLEQFLRVFLQKLTLRLLLETPVSEGVLRSSWYLNVNGEGGISAAQGASEASSVQGMPPGVTITRIYTMIDKVKVTDKLMLDNDTEYAQMVEYGVSGWFTGRAFRRRTIFAIPSLIAQTKRLVPKPGDL
jgi:hypothetical protein